MRLLDATRLAYGAALLIAPDRVSQALAGQPLDGRARTVARILGARHAGQALVVMTTGSAAMRRLGRAADALHAVSMLGLAAASPGRRRLALTDSAVASLLALALLEDAAPRRVVAPPTRAVDADPVSPLVAPPGSQGARSRRERAAQRQRAVRDIVADSAGQPIERVKRALVRALADRGLRPPPETWLDAVASDATEGFTYVVSEQAMADTGGTIPRGDPR